MSQQTIFVATLLLILGLQVCSEVQDSWKCDYEAFFVVDVTIHPTTTNFTCDDSHDAELSAMIRRLVNRKIRDYSDEVQNIGSMEVGEVCALQNGAQGGRRSALRGRERRRELQTSLTPSGWTYSTSSKCVFCSPDHPDENKTDVDIDPDIPEASDGNQVTPGESEPAVEIDPEVTGESGPIVDVYPGNDNPFEDIPIVDVVDTPREPPGQDNRDLMTEFIQEGSQSLDNNDASLPADARVLPEVSEMIELYDDNHAHDIELLQSRLAELLRDILTKRINMSPSSCLKGTQSIIGVSLTPVGDHQMTHMKCP